VLVEMCVLTNKKDAAFMASKAGQDKMVAALTRGIEAAVPRKK
jgi:N-acetylmuramoyl-L-alanine amidase